MQLAAAESAACAFVLNNGCAPEAGAAAASAASNAVGATRLVSAIPPR
jgi:hypothetical protein